MKTTLVTVLLLSIQLLFAQEITGSWQGELDVPGMKLPLIFHIKKEGEKLISTLDSPKQGATNIPVSTTSYSADQLTLELPALGISYSGKVTNESINGTFKQGGMELPLILSKLNRSQTPKAPFSYKIEEVTFINSTDKNTLAGTLSEPNNFNKKEPILIMITGSGKQNRDSALFGHKPFAVIADDFAKKGIATLRLDDRGIGGSSKGSNDETSFNYATDINAAVLFLKAKGFENIGLIGHSEGGMIAPIVASTSKDVKFLVLMAGPGQPINELLVLQNYLAGKLAGMSEEELQKSSQINRMIYDFIKNYKGTTFDSDFDKFINSSSEKLPDDVKKQVTNAWFRYFIAFNPDEYVSKIKIPVLAINGSLDFQVPAKENLEAIKKSLTKAKNKNFETYEFQGMNHLFQECTTGAMSEYAEIEQTISPKVLDKISSWISARK
ncbi:alpha/beta hydrolase family protein [Flavobacterium turcicum]|uniref:Alpha/beta hydrolase n=1 Tax=Flavobacterium turcicum TaxID=2764718 RepID=A0ABR7JBT2_9FLAO|nr:alpha/beta hydrolase [Flavobacterium turcicum]MBC5861961.1 alpha/beta hydrolase [Flavobacterium turcicum]NHL00692.1 alpha/beta hydrolase [Flavobacterium turcicum]